MCDIYGEFCKLCGEGYSFHLGDFNTERFEIAFICPKCFKRPEKNEHKPNVEKWLRNLHFKFAIWNSEEGNYAVLSITENAWEHRYQNHMNIGETELIEEVSPQTSASKVKNNEP